MVYAFPFREKVRMEARSATRPMRKYPRQGNAPLNGDTPGAVAMTKTLRERIDMAGVAIVPLHQWTF